MGISLRLGGFEIRDEIVWCYGSGFPKSLNIGKVVDEIQKNEREIIAIERRYNEPSGIVNIGQGERKPVNRKITKGNSEWEGWGTALKPAIEPIIVARKPLEKGLSIAENCLKWGTGGLNIDGCRIETKAKSFLDKGRKKTGTTLNWSNTDRKECFYNGESGRFPADLITDGSEEAKRLFPQNNSRFFYKARFSEDDFVPLFYCPKASKSERNMGLKGMPQKSIREEEGNPDNWDLSEGKVRARMVTKPQANFHPTVKPLALIEYLVKLITRKNQIVLDPFIGSGTTGIACKKLGRNYIGIEINDDYIKIAEKRIAGTLVNETLFDVGVIYKKRF